MAPLYLWLKILIKKYQKQTLLKRGLLSVDHSYPDLLINIKKEIGKDTGGKENE